MIYLNSLLFVQVLLVIFFNTVFYGFGVLDNFFWGYAVTNNRSIASEMLDKGVFGKHLALGFEFRPVEDLLGLFKLDTFPYVDPVFVDVVTAHEVAQNITCQAKHEIVKHTHAQVLVPRRPFHFQSSNSDPPKFERHVTHHHSTCHCKRPVEIATPLHISFLQPSDRLELIEVVLAKLFRNDAFAFDGGLPIPHVFVVH